MLGLAARAGALIPGTERVREAVRSSEVQFVLVASDASDNSRDKLLPLLDKRQVPYAVILTRDALGGAVGKAPLSAIGISERKLAERVRGIVEDLRI